MERKPLFSKNEVNTGRQPEIDALKAILIIGMILVHILEEVSPNENSAGVYLLLQIGNKFSGAVLFMFLMGMSSAYSRNQAPKAMLIRGFYLMTFGALLNLIRYALQAAIVYLINGDRAGLIDMSLIATSDIMQFAGLAFLTEGLLKLLKLDDLKILITAVLMSLGGMLLRNVGTGHYGTDQLLGHLWGTKTDSYFPLFHWFIFVAAGRCYGQLYKRLTDKRAWARRILPLGALISIAYLLIAADPNRRVFRLLNEEPTGFCWIAPWDALFILVGSMTLIALLCLLVRKECPPPLSFIGRNLNEFYCVSWVVIAALQLILTVSGDDIVEGTLPTVIVCLSVFGLTYGVVLLYQKCLITRMTGFFGRRRTLWIALIWVLMVVLFVLFFVPGFEYGQYPNMFNGYNSGVRV